MLSEENNLARGADEPLCLLLRMNQVSKSELLNGFRQLIPLYTDILVASGIPSNRTSFDERVLQVVEEVSRVLDTDAKSDEIFWKTPSSTNSRVDGCVPDRSSLQVKAKPTGKMLVTYDIAHGILIKLLTHPKLTLIPHKRVPPTIFSLSALLPVTKLRTEPSPSAMRW
jgi:hypothetical protein